MKEDDKYRGMDKVPFLYAMSKEYDKMDLEEYFDMIDNDRIVRTVELCKQIELVLKEMCEKIKEYNHVTTLEMVMALKMVSAKTIQAEAILKEFHEDVEGGN